MKVCIDNGLLVQAFAFDFRRADYNVQSGFIAFSVHFCKDMLARVGRVDHLLAQHYNCRHKLQKEASKGHDDESSAVIDTAAMVRARYMLPILLCTFYSSFLFSVLLASMLYTYVCAPFT